MLANRSWLPRFPITAVCLTLSLVGPVAGSEPPVSPAAGTGADGQFVVHEWGTFTSYSGSDGVRLDFRPLVDNDLPGFVFDGNEWSGLQIFTKARMQTRQRMETPVTYFYTDRVRQVNVKVGFPSGVLTEFYPPARRIAPLNVSTSITPGALPAELRNGLVDWGRVTLLPQSALRPNIPDAAVADAVARRAFEALAPGGDPEPELYTGDHYYYARDTDSALVHVKLDHESQTRNAEGAVEFPLRPVGDYFEKFLFYRGVGNFDLPLTVQTREDGKFGIVNSGEEALSGLILLQVRNREIRFSRLNDLAAGEARLAASPPEYVIVDGVEAHAALWNAMHAILLEQGLYDKEATAMIRTWDSSWFTEEGTRLLYIVPRKLTDELLPLTIEPAPQETVRVLVGRMEILPKDEEQRLQQVLADSAAARKAYLVQRAERDAERAALVAAGQQPPPEPAEDPLRHVPTEIRQLGRFAEPALVRIANITDDTEIRFESEHVLALLRSE